MTKVKSEIGELTEEFDRETEARLENFRKGYYQSLAFTAMEDYREECWPLFSGSGEFSDNHSNPESEFLPLLSEDERKGLLDDSLACFTLARKHLEPADDEYAGIDFHLTRNHHGSGFWDGDWSEPAATELTRIAHAFGSCELTGTSDGFDLVSCYLTH